MTERQAPWDRWFAHVRTYLADEDKKWVDVIVTLTTSFTVEYLRALAKRYPEGSPEQTALQQAAFSVLSGEMWGWTNDCADSFAERFRGTTEQDGQAAAAREGSDGARVADPGK